jgi:hypothetical protein
LSLRDLCLVVLAHPRVFSFLQKGTLVNNERLYIACMTIGGSRQLAKLPVVEAINSVCDLTLQAHYNKVCLSPILR